MTIVRFYFEGGCHFFFIVVKYSNLTCLYLFDPRGGVTGSQAALTESLR